LAAGEDHTCFALQSKGTFCTGKNPSGQIGRSPNEILQTAVPLQVKYQQ